MVRRFTRSIAICIGIRHSLFPFFYTWSPGPQNLTLDAKNQGLRHVSKPAVSVLQSREVWRAQALQEMLFFWVWQSRGSARPRKGNSAGAAMPPPRPHQTVKYL